MAFYRLLFFAESPQTPWPANAAEYTAFAVTVASETAIDLTAEPFSRDSAVWGDPMAYEACQALADAARGAGCEIIRYASVRDPEGGANLALLTGRAFSGNPTSRQTWRLRLSANGVQALCEFPERRLEFGRIAFAADPRIAALNWER
jgi:hypothetical protein